MTDKELLELAAKAAGIMLKGVGENGEYAFFYSEEHKGHLDWHPLTNDGDALRLAVKLNMNIYAGYSKMIAEIPSGGDEPCIHRSEVKEPDPCAATRRAIVRAAAEIGKGMK